ncbi:MAG: hypothetical protein HUJ31_07760, partial [Pseudomonadales bacterium]|nr:hypothetical protein [Pseudomonadales bacterium]
FHLTGSLADDATARIDGIRERLYQAREQRIHPVRDEKIITAWNGLMITSLALAGFELEKPALIEAAAKAADRIWASAFSDDDGLKRIVLDGQASTAANLEDYACLTESFVTLYKVEGTRHWLSRGERLVEDMLERFADREAGGFFLNRDTGVEGPLILKPRSPMDGATASGNSVALSAMVSLCRLGEYPAVENFIHQSLAGFSGLLKPSPSSFAYMVLAAEAFLSGERSRRQFAASGHVRASITVRGRRLLVDIAIDDGWHINASEPGDAGLTGTRIEGLAGTTFLEIEYPAGETGRPGSLSMPVQLYRGRVVIEAQLDVDVSRPTVALHLQACNDEMCLAPEVLQFRP